MWQTTGWGNGWRSWLGAGWTDADAGRTRDEAIRHTRPAFLGLRHHRREGPLVGNLPRRPRRRPRPRALAGDSPRSVVAPVRRGPHIRAAPVVDLEGVDEEQAMTTPWRVDHVPNG